MARVTPDEAWWTQLEDSNERSTIGGLLEINARITRLVDASETRLFHAQPSSSSKATGR